VNWIRLVECIVQRLTFMNTVMSLSCHMKGVVFLEYLRHCCMQCEVVPWSLFSVTEGQL
jgi:hypothetical protein